MGGCIRFEGESNSKPSKTTASKQGPEARGKYNGNQED